MDNNIENHQSPSKYKFKKTSNPYYQQLKSSQAISPGKKKKQNNRPLLHNVISNDFYIQSEDLNLGTTIQQTKIGDAESRALFLERSQSQTKQTVDAHHDLIFNIAHNDVFSSTQKYGRTILNGSSPKMVYKVMDKRMKAIANSQNTSVHMDKNKRKLPKIPYQYKYQGSSNGQINLNINKFLPPTSHNTSAQKIRRNQQNFKDQTNSQIRSSSQHLKSFIQTQMKPSSDRGTQPYQTEESRAQDSIALLDQEFKKNQAKQSQNQQNSSRGQKKSINMNEIMEVLSPTGQSQVNNGSLLNQGFDSRQPINVAYSNSFNTQLVVQNMQLNMIEVENLTKKLQLEDGQLEGMKIKEIKALIMESINDLKQTVILKEYQTIVTILTKMIQSIFNRMKDKSQSLKYLCKEQEITISKLKDGFSNLENMYFKSKVELETLKLDKKYFEEKLQQCEHQVYELQLDKNELEKKYFESMNEIEKETFKRKVEIDQLQQDDDRDGKQNQMNSDLLESLEKMAEQNTSLNNENKSLQDNLEYAKNKENKLMYLVFKMHKKGYPVNQIYEEEVKQISTRRFNNEMMENTEDQGLLTPTDPKGQSYISFDSEASYDEIGLVKVDPMPKPDFVPPLEFIGLPEYVSSDEEEQHNDVYYAAQKGQQNKNKSF